MAGTNKFIQWDQNGTNMYSDTIYATQTAINDGVSVGEIADPDLHNKLFYQMSTMCAAWGQAFADLGYTVNDSSLTSLTTILKNTIIKDNMWSLFTGDFHSQNTNGFYATTSIGQTNAPNVSDKFYLTVAKNDTYIYHLAMNVENGTHFYNVYNGSTWSGWSSLATVEQLQNYSFTPKTLDIITKGPWVDVRAFDTTNGADYKQAILNAKATGNYLYFPLIQNTATTYYIGSFTAGQFDGLFIKADEGVTLSFSNNSPYSLYKNINFTTDVNIFFRDISVNYIFPKTSLLTKKESIPPLSKTNRKRYTYIDATGTKINHRSVVWNTGDAFSVVVPTSTTTDTVNFVGATTGSFVGSFVEIGLNETISATFNSLSPTNQPIGVIIRGNLGYTILYRDPTAIGTLLNHATKLTGVAIFESTLTYEGRGTYTSFEIGNSQISVTKTSRDRAIVMLNGTAVPEPFFNSCGDIYEVGFVCYPSGAASFSITGFTIEKNDELNGLPRLEEIRIFGDSTAERFPGSWDKLLKPILDGSFGIKVNTITNYAVSGQTLEEQYTVMQANGFGYAYYVVVCVGTNNIQGLESLSTFKTNLATMIDYIIAQGRIPIMVMPWMWYTQSQSGGVGQASSNYDKGAPYRMIIERMCTEKGARLVNTIKELPNPAPSYLTTETDPLLRDNIHQSVMGYQLYALAISKTIASDYTYTPITTENILPSGFLGSGISGTFGYIVGSDNHVQLTGLLTATAPADGATVFTLPRFLSPSSTRYFPIMCTTGGSTPLGMGFITIDANGVAKIYKFVTGSNNFMIDNINYFAITY
jgi:lysophospholipase L1-like esterase